MKVLIGALFILLLGLQYKLWFEKNGIAHTLMLHRVIAKQIKYNQQLSLRNKALAAEVEDLKHGHDAIEERARNDLGMLRNGEIFYQIVKPDPAN